MNRGKELKNANEIINYCLTGDTKKDRLTGSKIKDHLENQFLTYCNKFISKDLEDRESQYQKLLAEKGLEHELEILSKFPNVVINQSNDNIEAFKHCLRSMERGKEHLASFPFFYLKGQKEGHIDLLRRNNSNQSLFGYYFYEVLEIKLAKHLQEKHIFQAAFYNDLLGRIQGYLPECFYLINGEGKETAYRFEEYREKLFKTFKEIRNIWKGNFVPEPTFNEVSYPWLSYANQIAREKDDLTLIPGIGGNTRKLMHEKNLKTVNDVSNVPLDVLTQIKGIGQKKATFFKARAKSLTSSKILHITPGKLKKIIPSSEIELYIDFEGIDPITNPTSMKPVDFLYGVIIKKKSEALYSSFIIFDLADSDEVKEVFHSFLVYLESFPDCPIFHWYHYEPTRIKRTIIETGLSSEYMKILSRLYDLSKPANNYWAFPLNSLSLKDLARFFGFNWNIKDFDGRGAIATYIDYINSFVKDDDLIKKICLYNKDDLNALIVLKNWMEENYNSHES